MNTGNFARIASASALCLGTGLAVLGGGPGASARAADNVEFVSPSGNISCDLGTNFALCQTGSPARSVIMSTAGDYKVCTGERCIGNPGEGTPVLRYGKSVRFGPFRCTSERVGVTCVTRGKGFQISRSGVRPVR